MDMKNIRAGYSKMLASLEDNGIKLDESQKETFDNFMVAIESKYNEVRDTAIKATRKIVAEKMNAKFKAAFENYQKHLFENVALTRMIQEKVDEIKKAKTLSETKTELGSNSMKELEESVDQFLDGYIEEVLPKKSIVDYDQLRKMTKLTESLKKELEEAKKPVEKKVDESIKDELEKTKADLSKVNEELEKAKGKVLLESKLEDVPPLEAKKMREKFEGCKECEVKENFDKVLEEIRDGVEKEQTIPTAGKEPTTLESEINSILETPEEGKTEDSDEVPGDVPQNALPMDVPKGIDEDGDEVYETEVDLYESSGEFDTIDQKAMDYFITKLENSYKFAR